MMKVLFVGLGSIGLRHLKNLYSLGLNDFIVFRYRKNSPPGKIPDGLKLTEFTSYQDALNQKPDIVVISNPSVYHFDYAMQAMSLGCNVYLEKPVSHNIDNIDKMLALHKEKQVNVQVGCQLRMHPHLIKIKEWLISGDIGEIYSVSADVGEYLPGFHPYEDYRKTYPAIKSLGGGVILSQIHEFDYALWLFGKPKRIFALGGQLSNLEINAEDTASVLMECECNGKVLPVSMTLDFLQSPPRRTCTIVGDQGSIIWDYHGKSAVLQHRSTGKTETLDFSSLERNQLFVDELKHFLSAVKGETVPVVDIRLGHESLKMALAALASIDTGEVQDLE